MWKELSDSRDERTATFRVNLLSRRILYFLSFRQVLKQQQKVLKIKNNNDLRYERKVKNSFQATKKKIQRNKWYKIYLVFELRISSKSFIFLNFSTLSYIACNLKSRNSENKTCTIICSSKYYNNRNFKFFHFLQKIYL